MSLTKEQVKLSKFLAKNLRHNPNIMMDIKGYVEIKLLKQLAKQQGLPHSNTDIQTVVENTEKIRYEYSKDKRKLRAMQGHSILVNIELIQKTPPEILYHGTSYQSLDKILDQGLFPMGRQHVHLTEDYFTALKIGVRKGTPVVLKIITLPTQIYFQANNGVWLTSQIAPSNIEVLHQKPYND